MAIVSCKLCQLYMVIAKWPWVGKEHAHFQGWASLLGESQETIFESVYAPGSVVNKAPKCLESMNSGQRGCEKLWAWPSLIDQTPRQGAGEYFGMVYKGGQS